jgi:hypothetical protein
MKVPKAAALKCFAMCLALSLACAAARAQSRDTSKDEFRIDNRTRSLEVVKAERSGDQLVLTVRNNYAQPLTGLVVSPKKGATGGFSYWGEGEALAPGETRTESFHMRAGGESRDLIILAAFLADCTIDGDPEAAKEEQAQRRGEKEQNEKALALVGKALDSPKFDARKSLDRLERDLHALAESAARAPWQEGRTRRVSHSTFVWARVAGIRKAFDADNGFDVRGALTRLRALLEARRNSC